MFQISDDQFAGLIEEAFETLPPAHVDAIKNVAIVYADDPTPSQREELKLLCHQTLYGLYEGVPLPQRQGMTHYGPDKITIFKGPMQEDAESLDDLREMVRHTLWHEVAHYFGLNHDQIHELENRPPES